MEAYAAQNIAYWTRRAPGYSAVNRQELGSRQHGVWSAVICSRLRDHFRHRDPGTLRVLDIGTGPGFFAILLAEQGYAVTAVDYTGAMLDQARTNAGPLAEKIAFRQMNAEELSFPDGSFDAIVTRNLTWNLPHPEAAYAQWVRVLKPGGLLLNFDANWYRYLYDPRAMTLHRQDRDNVVRSLVEDDTAGTDVAAMEAIARQAPLSGRVRPAWDLEVLEELGMTARAEKDIWKQVWTRDERVNNASTPMFLVRAVKTGLPG